MRPVSRALEMHPKYYKVPVRERTQAVLVNELRMWSRKADGLLGFPYSPSGGGLRQHHSGDYLSSAGMPLSAFSPIIDIKYNFRSIFIADAFSPYSNDDCISSRRRRGCNTSAGHNRLHSRFLSKDYTIGCASTGYGYDNSERRGQYRTRGPIPYQHPPWKDTKTMCSWQRYGRAPHDSYPSMDSPGYELRGVSSKRSI